MNRLLHLSKTIYIPLSFFMFVVVLRHIILPSSLSIFLCGISTTNFSRGNLIVKIFARTIDFFEWHFTIDTFLVSILFLFALVKKTSFYVDIYHILNYSCLLWSGPCHFTWAFSLPWSFFIHGHSRPLYFIWEFSHCLIFLVYDCARPSHFSLRI